MLDGADIEALTKKTENSKKFAVFVKMLSSALSRANDTVFIDLLTTADLEMLKARKTGPIPCAPIFFDLSL